TCADGACTPVICEPNKTQCTADRKAAQVCTARGISWDKTLCQIDEACVGGSCVKLKCKPGKKTCGKDGAVLTCNPDGQDHTSQACKSSEACDPGYGTPGAQAFCKAQVCQPDTSFCAEKKAYKCASSGLEAVELDNCNKNDSLGKPMACKLGACVSVKCEPGALTCLGWTTIGKCKSDGSGYTSTDCGSKSVCEGSQCKTKICAPNEKFCDGTTAKLCDTVGVNESVIADCKSTGTQCVKGACVKAVCTDGQKNCSADFTAIELCVKGAWVPTPCAKGQACTASACKPKICEPGTKSCKNGAPVTCDVSGTAETVGNSCGSKAVCVKGACLTKDCPATTTQCKNATTQLVCNANSVGGVEKACPAKTACKNGTCIKAVCKPSDAWCEGSVGKTCATDGTKLLSSVDCAKMGQVCKEGGCIEPGCGDGQCQKTKGETCTSCPKDCGACPFNGCTARTKAGCDKCTCEACVCQLDPSCCSNAWSGFCANLCKTACNGTCP
ncbi:MAG: hypothetical protein KC502_14610, partial [Myxococcales bacterium]|nr:hypothetical protein [Myxococcales bacterium]